MPRITFSSILLGDSADDSRTLLERPQAQEGGADEVIQHVGGDYVLALARGQASMTLRFRVAHTFGTIAEAEASVLEWPGTLPREGALEFRTEIGETITLRMQAVRRPVTGAVRGVTVEWNYEFVGDRFQRVVSTGTVPDYDGGEADSGDTFTRFFWGGLAGDGAGVGAEWSRTLDGGEA